MRRRAYIGIAAAAAILVCAAVLIHIVRAQAFMTEAGRMAESLAAEKLGTTVHIGAVEIRSLHELKLDDIVIYDRQAKAVLRADEARVTLRLLSLLSAPETSVDEILLTGAHAEIVQRADGTWNYSDLGRDDAEPSSFEGRIRMEGATATVTAGERTYELDGITGAVDVDRSDVSYDLTGALAGVPLHVRGTYVGGTQELYLAAEDADLTPLLKFLPEGALPEEVQVHRVHAGHVGLKLRRTDGVLTLDGRVDSAQGAANIYGTETQLKSSALTFNERSLFLAATAEAAGQTARVDGTIRFDTDAPYLDLTLRAKDFAVDQILPSSSYVGPVTADVHVTGTFAAPMAEGHLSAAEGAVDDVSFRAASADVSYADGTISFHDLTAEIFDGKLSGAGVFDTRDQSYTAHLTADGIRGAACAFGSHARGSRRRTARRFWHTRTGGGCTYGLRQCGDAQRQLSYDSRGTCECVLYPPRERSDD